MSDTTTTTTTTTVRDIERVRAASYLQAIARESATAIAAKRGEREAKRALRTMSEYSDPDHVLAALDARTVARVESEAGLARATARDLSVGIEDAIDAIFGAGE